MKRSFELLDGKSAKFWEIEVEGTSHTVRYGKLGAKGTTKTKSFADTDKCQKSADKLIAAKTKKGYVEVQDQAAAAPGVDEAALAAELAKLDADPSQASRVVFGDWLQSVGHPWGQLISLDHAGMSDKRDALLESTPALLGELARRTKHVTLTWDTGFIDTATVESGGNAKILQQCLQALFAQPCARYLRRVVLDAPPERMTTTRDWDYGQDDNIVAPFGPQVVKTLAQAPASLTELVFGKAPPRGASAYVRPPKLAGVAEHLPELAHLEVQCAGGSFSSFNHAKLRRLELRFANAGNGDLEAVRGSELPALEQLSIWLGGTVYCTLDEVYPPDEIDDWDAHEAAGYPLRYPHDYPSSALEEMGVYSASTDARAADLGALCNDEWPATLTRLGLQSGVFDEAALTAIFTSSLVAKLSELDLSGGAIGSKQVQTITSHAKQLEHLERLDLSRNQLNDKDVAAIKKALPKAECGDQRRANGAPEFLMRYVACME